MDGPSPIVFAGPSGAGKGTIIKALMDQYPDKFGFSVSHTTRGPRPGEENGVHYNFVEKADMEAAIANHEFIEYAHVHTNIYGTSIKAVETVRSKGKICILDIDIQGVKLVKQSKLQCKYVFISPPSIDELEKRLRGRGTELEDKIQVRLTNAIGEMEYGNTDGNFDSIIINEDLNTAVEDIVKLLAVWYPDHTF